MHKINLWTNLQAKNVHEWSVQNKVKCFLPVEKNLYLGSFMGLVSKPLKIQINSCVYSMRWFDIKWYIAEVMGHNLGQFDGLWHIVQSRTHGTFFKNSFSIYGINSCYLFFIFPVVVRIGCKYTHPAGRFHFDSRKHRNFWLSTKADKRSRFFKTCFCWTFFFKNHNFSVEWQNSIHGDAW